MENDPLQSIELNAIGIKALDAIIADPVAAMAILEPIWRNPQETDQIPDLHRLNNMYKLRLERYQELSSYISSIIRKTDLFLIVDQEIANRYEPVMQQYDDKLPEQIKHTEEIAKQLHPNQDKDTLRTLSNRAFMLIQVARYALQISDTQQDQNIESNLHQVS